VLPSFFYGLYVEVKTEGKHGQRAMPEEADKSTTHISNEIFGTQKDATPLQPERASDCWASTLSFFGCKVYGKTSSKEPSALRQIDWDPNPGEPAPSPSVTV
jgi:hypothetical protein